MLLLICLHHALLRLLFSFPTRRSSDLSIADRVLLDGTIEHHDQDGTFTHVTLDDGSTILIDGDMDHPYVVHRNLAEFSYETHQLTAEQSRERFAQMSPALAAHDRSNADHLADEIGRAHV